MNVQLPGLQRDPRRGSSSRDTISLPSSGGAEVSQSRKCHIRGPCISCQRRARSRSGVSSFRRSKIIDRRSRVCLFSDGEPWILELSGIDPIRKKGLTSSREVETVLEIRDRRFRVPPRPGCRHGRRRATAHRSNTCSPYGNSIRSLQLVHFRFVSPYFDAFLMAQVRKNR